MGRSLRNAPHFSVNKLAEYMEAMPRRRRSLIIDQIKQPTVKVIHYEDARRALVRFFGDPNRTRQHLLESAAFLRDRAAEIGKSDEHRAQCLLSGARAVEAFTSIADEVRTKRILAVPGPRRHADLNMGGVRIVVTPDICVLERGTERRIGAVKFHFPRTQRLSQGALQYAATLLFHYLQKQGDTPQRRECIAVDVFSERYESAPTAMRDRLKDVEAACEEIAERWPAIFDALVREGAIPPP
jgi:hypothetical protein